MASKAAAAPVDWTRLFSKLGLPKQTVAGLQAFRGRNEAARRANNALKATSTTVNFDQYRKVLKNQEIVDQMEKALKDFKPATYDVSAQVKAIDQFQSKAVASASEAKTKIDQELKQLEATLKDIEEARAFDDLTLEDVIKARPEVAKAVEGMVKSGNWTVPGYNEKFGNLSAL